MLEQKHNKRAAISQSSSDSNPNRLNPVTSAPSQPLQWTNVPTEHQKCRRKDSKIPSA